MNSANAIRRKPSASGDRAALAQITVTPTLRATLVEGLSRMFAFERGGSLKSVCLFATSIATLSWFVDSLLPVVQEASQYLIGWSSGNAPTHHFAEPLVKLALPLLAFGATVAFLIFNAHRNAWPFVVASGVPDPHLGLILQLSVYQPRTQLSLSRVYKYARFI
jgi:hypothetical protein